MGVRSHPTSVEDTMNASTAGYVVAGLLLIASQAQAQRIGAELAVRSGPVVGHVVINDRVGYSTYRRPAPRVVVVERYAPRVIVVERVRRGHTPRHWRRHGYRTVTVYYVDGRYYDRYLPHRRGVREVVVYERDGRYLAACDGGDRDVHHIGYDWDD
jgi:hypothetical protein